MGFVGQELEFWPQHTQVHEFARGAARWPWCLLSCAAPPATVWAPARNCPAWSPYVDTRAQAHGPLGGPSVAPTAGGRALTCSITPSSRGARSGRQGTGLVPPLPRTYQGFLRPWRSHGLQPHCLLRFQPLAAEPALASQTLQQLSGWHQAPAFGPSSFMGTAAQSGCPRPAPDLSPAASA